jgi:hypothetical protein
VVFPGKTEGLLADTELADPAVKEAIETEALP